MKKLIYDERTKIIDIVEQEKMQILKELKNVNQEARNDIDDEMNKVKKESNGIRNCLERNRIFFEVFSWVFLGIMGAILSFVGININNKTMEIYEMQLQIEENDRNPHFNLKCKNVWKKVNETKGTDKIAKNRYTITNNGGNITNVFIWAESQILFYIPTEVEDEWYIFRYITHNFDVNHNQPRRQKEKDRKFIFYEYTSENNKNESIDRQMELGKYLKENLNKEVTYTVRNFLHIIYTDYMGKEKIKLFRFDSLGIWEVEQKQEGVFVGITLDAIKTNTETMGITPPIDINDNQAIGKALKEEIEDWMEKNKGAKGYKDVAHVFYNYDIVP